MNKRRIHSPVLKARVVMETIIGRKTFMEIAAGDVVHPVSPPQGEPVEDVDAGGRNRAVYSLARSHLPSKQRWNSLGVINTGR